MRKRKPRKKVAQKIVKETGPILSNEARLVETILYLENIPLTAEKLGHMANLDEEALDAAIQELKEHFDLFMHGLDLPDKNDVYQFVPSSDLHDELKACYGKKVDRRLSKASIETLSIIAYSQPITRREIDNIRGVSSDTIVRLLRDREYIKVIGRKDVPGHPCLYGTSRKFLMEFNIKSISDLPRLNDIDEERFDSLEQNPNKEEENI